MASPTSGLLETAPGGLPLVRDFGLNTAKASNLAGVTIDTSGNTQVPGTFGSTGAATLSSTLAVTGTSTLSGAVTQKANVISGSGATVTLTAAQSGSVVLFDRAAGIVFTLPAPAVGMYFDFVTTVTITSNAATVITDAGTTFMTGSVVLGTDNTASKSFLGNGTSHVKITSNGSTTGGIIGGAFRVTCVSSTLWSANGNLAASGTLATPFST